MKLIAASLKYIFLLGAREHFGTRTGAAFRWLANSDTALIVLAYVLLIAGIAFFVAALLDVLIIVRNALAWAVR
jgi:hypothetical protein